MIEETAGRTEDQIIAQAPIKVVLGGRTWEVRPLTINEAVRWRERAFTELEKVSRAFTPPRRPLLAFLRRDHDETAAFVASLKVAFFEVPRLAGDLFFSYASVLPRREIERVATERELVTALLEVWKVAFPFLELLRTAVVMAAPPGSGRSTSSSSTSGASRRSM